MQQLLQPLPGYPEPYGSLAAVLIDATADWRGEIDIELNADAMVWRARPNGPSMGAILLHMIAVEIFWIERFVLGRPWDPEERAKLMVDLTNVDKSVGPDAPAEPFGWYTHLQDDVRARILESLRTWPPPHTALPREGEPNLYSPLWVLGHVIQHESYHGGQIIMLADLWKHQSHA